MRRPDLSGTVAELVEDRVAKAHATSCLSVMRADGERREPERIVPEDRGRQANGRAPDDGAWREAERSEG